MSRRFLLAESLLEEHRILTRACGIPPPFGPSLAAGERRAPLVGSRTEVVPVSAILGTRLRRPSDSHEFSQVRVLDDGASAALTQK